MKNAASGTPSVPRIVVAFAKLFQSKPKTTPPRTHPPHVILTLSKGTLGFFGSHGRFCFQISFRFIQNSQTFQNGPTLNTGPTRPQQRSIKPKQTFCSTQTEHFLDFSICQKVSDMFPFSASEQKNQLPSTESPWPGCVYQSAGRWL